MRLYKSPRCTSPCIGREPIRNFRRPGGLMSGRRCSRQYPFFGPVFPCLQKLVKIIVLQQPKVRRIHKFLQTIFLIKDARFLRASACTRLPELTPDTPTPTAKRRRRRMQAARRADVGLPDTLGLPNSDALTSVSSSLSVSVSVSVAGIWNTWMFHSVSRVPRVVIQFSPAQPV